MQDAYVGDIGDFGKFALLRILARKTKLRIGIVWHFVDPTKLKTSSISKDGKHRQYLGNDKEDDPHCVRGADPELYKSFSDNNFREPSGHSLASLEKICPEFEYFHDCCHDRLVNRNRWIENAAEKLDFCDLILFDPDNGINLQQENSPKHVNLSELDLFWNKKKSLIVYHHLGRKEEHGFQIRDWEEKLTKRFVDSEVRSVHFRRGTSRVYFVVSQPNHEAIGTALNEATVLESLKVPLREWKRRD